MHLPPNLTIPCTEPVSGTRKDRKEELKKRATKESTGSLPGTWDTCGPLYSLPLPVSWDGGPGGEDSVHSHIFKPHALASALSRVQALPTAACSLPVPDLLAPCPATDWEHQGFLPGDLWIGFGQRKKHFGPCFWTPLGCSRAPGVTFCHANQGCTRTVGQWVELAETPTPKPSQTPKS